MKRKKIWLKLGVFVSIISISVSAAPYQTQVQAKTEYAQTQESKEQKVSSQEYNKTALDFVASLDPKDFQTWDQSLGEMTEKEAAEIKTFMEANITKDEQNDYQKAKRIFEWIAKNIRYAGAQDHNISLRPYDVFKNKVAVCGGYSNLYKAMLNLADIPAVLVTGDTPAGAHAWNIVYADGKWFFSDSTWGTGDLNNFDYGLDKFSTNHTSVDLQGVSVTDENGMILGFHKGLAVLGVTGETKTITVPKEFNGIDVTSVSQTALSEKYGIEHIVLTEKVDNMETQYQSRTLKSITVPKENPSYASKDGVLFTKDLTKILVYPYQKEDTSFVMPKEVDMYDEKETFQNPHLQEILVEEGNDKFSSYDGAIYNADKTKLLTIPEGKEKIYVAGTVELDNIALNGKTNLKEVAFEDGIAKLPPYVLNNCTGLKKVYIPNSVKEIAEDAFANVEMKELTILGEKGSTAEKFAKEHQMKFIDVKEIEIKVEETKELIQKAKEYDDASVYTEESIAALRKAIEEAENVVGQSDVTVEQLNQAIENLNSAITNMVEIEEEPEVPVVPEEVIAKKKEARELLEKAKRYDNPSVYTEESVKALRGAMRSVEDLLEKDDVTVEELEKAMDNLTTVMNAMEKPDEPNKPETPEVPPTTETPSVEETPEQNHSETPKTSDVSTPGAAGLGAILSMAVIALLQRRKK